MATLVSVGKGASMRAGWRKSLKRPAARMRSMVENDTPSTQMMRWRVGVAFSLSPRAELALALETHASTCVRMRMIVVWR